MRCLLDRLHEDTKEEVPRIEAAQSSGEDAEKEKEKEKDKEKEKETKPHSGDSNDIAATTATAGSPPSPPPPPIYASIVSRLFQGYLLSRIRCLKCGKVFIIYFFNQLFIYLFKNINFIFPF
jgi:hypothetical protein